MRPTPRWNQSKIWSQGIDHIVKKAEDNCQPFKLGTEIEIYLDHRNGFVVCKFQQDFQNSRGSRHLDLLPESGRLYKTWIFTFGLGEDNFSSAAAG